MIYSVLNRLKNLSGVWVERAVQPSSILENVWLHCKHKYFGVFFHKILGSSVGREKEISLSDFLLFKT